MSPHPALSCSNAGILRANLRRKALPVFTVGILLGVAIWGFSPWLTGKVEPWDADSPVWPFSWALVAVAGGTIGHLRGICLPLGYAFGQMLVTIQSVFRSEFGVLGWLFILGYAAAAISVTLALIGGVALLRYFRHRRTTHVDCDQRWNHLLMTRTLTENSFSKTIPFAAKLGYGIAVPLTVFLAYQYALIESTSGTGSWDGMSIFFGSLIIVPALLAANGWVIAIRWRRRFWVSVAGMVLPLLVAVPEYLYLYGPHKRAIHNAFHGGHVAVWLFVFLLFLPLFVVIVRAVHRLVT
jgi:hypothetical protein